jgi:hypothetical protein
MVSASGRICGKPTCSGRHWGQCFNRSMPSTRSLPQRYAPHLARCSFDLSAFTSSDFFAFLQAQDGPEPENDDGTPFEFAPTAPVMLFGRDAPPLAKVILHGASRQGKSLVVKVGKRKRSAAAAPQAKPRKMITRQGRQATPPIPSESEHSTDDQVCPLFALLHRCCTATDIHLVGRYRERSWR